MGLFDIFEWPNSTRGQVERCKETMTSLQLLPSCYEDDVSMPTSCRITPDYKPVWCYVESMMAKLRYKSQFVRISVNDGVRRKREAGCDN